MALQALAGQLYIINGVAQDAGKVPGVVAQRGPQRAKHGRDREFLFVHLTLTGPLSENAALADNLVEQLSRSYFESSGSVTSTLRQVVTETNRRLLSLNLGGREQSREGAITCAVLRGQELFVVQVGESLALMGHNFGVERLPARRPERLTPLGRSAGIDFRYYHQRLQSGDMLLLADPRLGHLPGYALTPALVDTELDLGLAELQDA
jgi:hypothetical protein